jgi:hypothetical protein
MLDRDEINCKVDQRRDYREPASHYCWADLGDGRFGIDCRLLDISNSGARIVPLEETPLPDSFTLRIGRTGTRRLAHVVWRDGGEIGVTFEKPSAGR